jgi:hypothetical protein
MLDQLAWLVANQVRVPDEKEFPNIRPRLGSCEFPVEITGESAPDTARVAELRREIGRSDSRCVRFVCPWFANDQIEPGTIDLLFSQAVMEHVVDVDGTYEAMSRWMRRGGVASHVIDFTGHYISNVWNGHWRFPQWLWRLAVGRREFALNRKPLSYHLRCVERAGFEIVSSEVEYREDGIGRQALPFPFRDYSDEDLRTSGAYLILRRV